MKVSNKHPMVLIRAVTVLSFGLLLTAQSVVSAPVADNSVDVTDADVRDIDRNYTAIAGVNLTTMEMLDGAQKMVALEAAQNAVVSTPLDETEEEPAEAEDLTAETIPEVNSDIALIARLIHAEAGSLSLKEKARVGLTVYYRTDSSRWPNTVSGNIYKSNQYATPSGSYTDSDLEAAELAYALWSEGRGSELLPEDCLSFFGNGSHNYFYNKSLQIYYAPDVSTPSDIYDQMTQIIPALRRSAEQQAEIAENSEQITESVDEETVENPDMTSEDSAQLETETPSYEEEINYCVSQGTISEEQETLSTGQSSGASEIPSDLGN